MWSNLNLFWTPLLGCRLFSKRYPEFSVHRTKFVVQRFCKQGRYFVGGVDVWTQCPPLTPFLIRARNQPVWGFPLFCTCACLLFLFKFKILVALIWMWNWSLHMTLLFCLSSLRVVIWQQLASFEQHWLYGFLLCTLCVMSCIKHGFADANITLSRIFCVSSNKIWQRESFSEDH